MKLFIPKCIFSLVAVATLSACGSSSDNTSSSKAVTGTADVSVSGSVKPAIKDTYTCSVFGQYLPIPSDLSDAEFLDEAAVLEIERPIFTPDQVTDNGCEPKTNSSKSEVAGIISYELSVTVCNEQTPYFSLAASVPGANGIRFGTPGKAGDEWITLDVDKEDGLVLPNGRKVSGLRVSCKLKQSEK